MDKKIIDEISKTEYDKGLKNMEDSLLLQSIKIGEQLGIIRNKQEYSEIITKQRLRAKFFYNSVDNCYDCSVKKVV